jgi:hypothetical protein
MGLFAPEPDLKHGVLIFIKSIATIFWGVQLSGYLSIHNARRRELLL